MHHADSSFNSLLLSVVNNELRRTNQPFRVRSRVVESENSPVSIMQHIQLSPIMLFEQTRDNRQEPLQEYTVEGDLGACAICLEDMKVGEKINILPCSNTVHHKFHSACLAPWIQQHNSCPTCRQNIT